MTHAQFFYLLIFSNLASPLSSPLRIQSHPTYTLLSLPRSLPDSPRCSFLTPSRRPRLPLHPCRSLAAPTLAPSLPPSFRPLLPSSLALARSLPRMLPPSFLRTLILSLAPSPSRSLATSLAPSLLLSIPRYLTPSLAPISFPPFSLPSPFPLSVLRFAPPPSVPLAFYSYSSLALTFAPHQKTHHCSYHTSHHTHNTPRHKQHISSQRCTPHHTVKP